MQKNTQSMSHIEINRHVHFERSLVHIRSKMHRPSKKYIKLVNKLQGVLKHADQKLAGFIAHIERLLENKIKFFND